jgi:hypothetical protein
MATCRFLHLAERTSLWDGRTVSRRIEYPRFCRSRGASERAQLQAPSASSPAVQIQPDLGSEWLADRIVVIAQLAEELDRGTLDLALRIVPVQWWEERLGTTAAVDQSR